MVRELEILAGTTITKAAKDAYELVLLSGEEVTFKFNDVTLTATEETQPQDLVKAYDDECKKRLEAYEQTPEYARKQKRDEAMREQYQQRTNELIAVLPEAIQGGDTAVVQWGHDFYIATELSGVEYAIDDVIKPLLAAGYQANEYVGTSEDALKADRTMMAHYLMGQFINCVQQVHALPNVFFYFTEDYLR